MAQDTSPSLADKVQRLEDIFEISQLKAKYCRYVDTRDWAGYGSLLTEDYVFHSDGGMHRGREAVVAFVSKSLGQATTVHQVHTPEITFTGRDMASAIWPMFDYVRMPSDEGEFILRGYGWYHEDYIRTALGWRMKRSVERRQRVDMEGQVPKAVASLMNDSTP